MPQLVIEVDEDVSRRLAARATAAGFADAVKYAGVLLAQAVDEAADADGPPHLLVRNDDDLAKLLRDRLEDSRPPIPARPAFWADLRRQIAERIASAGEPSPGRSSGVRP